jgi:hypothetical protein
VSSQAAFKERESWRDHRCFFLKYDRPASRGAFAKAIATIAKENAISLFFLLLNRVISLM